MLKIGFPDDEPVRVTVPQTIDEPEIGGLGGQAFEMLLDALEEAFLLEQVARRVAGDGEFGEDDDVGARFSRAAGEGLDFAGVAVQVADGGIDLCERDLHR